MIKLFISLFIFLLFNVSIVYGYPNKYFDNLEQYQYNEEYFEGDIIGPDPKVKVFFYILLTDHLFVFVLSVTLVWSH